MAKTAKTHAIVAAAATTGSDVRAPTIIDGATAVRPKEVTIVFLVCQVNLRHRGNKMNICLDFMNTGLWTPK
jgi:hypothetical protein